MPSRSFPEFHTRILDIEMRDFRIKNMWEIFSEENPIISLFYMRKFNRVLKTNHEIKKAEYIKGTRW